MAGTEATLYEIRKGGAAWITLNRPENRNALSAVLVTEVFDHLEAANADDNVRSIVITGNGPAFCAGADLKSPPGAAGVQGRSVAYTDVLAAIQDSPKPVIAAINGAAFAGGLGLVGASDIVVTRADVQFSFSEVRIGVIPAVISVVCLPKLGTHHGMKLFITGERFTGEQAVEMGFAHRAVPEAALLDAVQEEVDMINLGGPIAVQQCKKLVRTVPGLSREEGFEVTGPWSGQMFQSDEGQEGMAAFREKRNASWIKD
ncbi:MAG: enoyl-CoA hydratase-related protein [Pseudomonadota bacterium]